MALRVSPERVRDVRFAEQWRGYRTDEVDDFVDQVAEAFDQLEGRLEEAAQRTELAERRLEERGPDEDLGRTLVLAQRTADAALEEAQAEATRLVNEAEERARSILDDLEARKATLEGDIEARIQAELVEVSERRTALEADIERMSSYVEHHRSRLIEELRAHLEWLERVGPLEPLVVPVPLTTGEPATVGDGPEVGDGATERSDVSDVVDSSENSSGMGPAHPIPADDIESDDGSLDAILQEVDGQREVDGQKDDTELDDLDAIPWAGPPDAGDAPGGDESDADPFIAELRRAVDDPEPLGPRDEIGEWAEDVDIYDRRQGGPIRSRRRRRRP
ncbi:hypothetical protein BH24ACT1_BH24ACT1_04760 [soil metagenome]